MKNSSIWLAMSSCVAIASMTSPARSQAYPPIPFTPDGMSPYPDYPPPNRKPPPAYVPPPDYVPFGPSPILEYQEGVAPPQGYHLERRPREDLVIQGGLVLGGSYLFSAFVGATSSNTDDRWLLLPVFGPFLDILVRTQHRCDAASPGATCNVFDQVTRFYLALDGVAQVAGGALFASGFIFQKKELVMDSYDCAALRGPRVTRWTLVPEVAPSRYGLMLRGELF
jgi:hypothetical protein